MYTPFPFANVMVDGDDVVKVDGIACRMME